MWQVLLQEYVALYSENSGNVSNRTFSCIALSSLLRQMFPKAQIIST